VRIGQVKKGSNPDAVRSAGAIFSRPDPKGAMDPAWNPTQDILDKVRLAMTDQNCVGAVVPHEKRAEFLKCLRALAKASPAVAATLGDMAQWETGFTPFVVGRGPASSMQSAINSGRTMQRSVLFAAQYDASLDLRILLPGVFEGASAQGTEATEAARTLALMLGTPGFEPIAVGRLGKLVAPKPRAVPPFMQILEPSLEAPEAKPAATKPAGG
jgi:hypothetical protein